MFGWSFGIKGETEFDQMKFADEIFSRISHFIPLVIDFEFHLHIISLTVKIKL